MSLLRAPDQFSPQRRGTSTTPTCGGCCCCCCCLGTVVGASIALPVALVRLGRAADTMPPPPVMTPQGWMPGPALPPRPLAGAAALIASAVPLGFGIIVAASYVADAVGQETGQTVFGVAALIAVALTLTLIVLGIRLARLPREKLYFPVPIAGVAVLTLTLEVAVGWFAVLSERFTWTYGIAALVAAGLMIGVGWLVSRRPG